MENSRLYVIVGPGDAGRLGLSLEALVEEAVRGGADLVQLRDKALSDVELVPLAERARRAAHAAGGLLVVNDRIAVAARARADGVHLGQDDASVAEARAALGPRALVGKSTHSAEQALRAEREGADYIGIGPVFATPTKPDTAAIGLETLAEVARRVRIPFFAIGGMDLETIPRAAAAGARRVAVVRAALGSRDVRAAVGRLKEAVRGNDAA